MKQLFDPSHLQASSYIYSMVVPGAKDLLPSDSSHALDITSGFDVLPDPGTFDLESQEDVPTGHDSHAHPEMVHGFIVLLCLWLPMPIIAVWSACLSTLPIAVSVFAVMLCWILPTIWLLSTTLWHATTCHKLPLGLARLTGPIAKLPEIVRMMFLGLTITLAVACFSGLVTSWEMGSHS